MTYHDPSLTAEHYELIGATVVSFGYLEHEVLRAAISLLGGPHDMNQNDERECEKHVEGTLAPRFRYFCKIARTNAVDEDWLSDLEQKMEQAILWRNIICHAQWEFSKNGKLRATFFRRGCIKRGHPDISEITTNELREIGHSTFANAKLLAATF